MKNTTRNTHARRKGEGELAAIAVVAVLLIAVIGGFMVGYPKYRVYSAHMAGQAELAQAESNRQIQVREAVAKRDSAKMLAEAEVERARGVAKANGIIGQSLQGNDAYLRYLYIQGLNDADNKEIIYIPTEGTLPILEAGRRGLGESTPKPPKN